MTCGRSEFLPRDNMTCCRYAECCLQLGDICIELAKWDQAMEFWERSRAMALVCEHVHEPRHPGLNPVAQAEERMFALSTIQ